MSNAVLLFAGLACLLPLVVAAIFAVVVIFVRRRQMPGGPQGGEPSALDILKTRLAQGEITREQFEQMRKDLE